MYSITIIQSGTLEKKVSEKIRDFLKLNNGKRISIEIRKFYKKRGIQANRYYWAVVVRNWALHYLGDEEAIQEMHSYLGDWYRKREGVNKLTGQIFEYTLSTTAMNTVEFSSYVNQCMLKGNEEGIEFECSEHFYET